MKAVTGFSTGLKYQKPACWASRQSIMPHSSPWLLLALKGSIPRHTHSYKSEVLGISPEGRCGNCTPSSKPKRGTNAASCKEKQPISNTVLFFDQNTTRCAGQEIKFLGPYCVLDDKGEIVPPAMIVHPKITCRHSCPFVESKKPSPSLMRRCLWD